MGSVGMTWGTWQISEASLPIGRHTKLTSEEHKQLLDNDLHITRHGFEHQKRLIETFGSHRFYTMDSKMEVHHEEHALSIAPQFVPGTEILYDFGEGIGVDADHLNSLQHVRHGDGHILLVPQPSIDDPSDPLRWPPWKKAMALFNGLWYSFNGAITGPIMAAGMQSLDIDWRSSFV